MSKQQGPLCTWAMNNFPRVLKNKYSAFCKANGVRMVDHTEYLISKTLRDAGVNIPPIQRDNTLFKTNINKES